MTDRIARYFGAGAAGGFLNSMVVWLFGSLGLSAALGVAIAPHLSPGWLYPRVVWGGIWGVLLFLPVCPIRPWLRAFLLSLGPTLVQLLIVFPLKAGKGMAGIDLGLLTPLLVIFFNWVWGVTALFFSSEFSRRN